MAETTIQLSNYLKTYGYSDTKQRRTLFDILSGSESKSMRELCDAAKGDMDRASVYRTIDLFEKVGVVRRINIGWKYKIELSDAFAEHHHHLTCLNCKKIIPINEDALENFITDLATGQNFRPVEHQIEIQGYCSDCAKRL